MPLQPFASNKIMVKGEPAML